MNKIFNVKDFGAVNDGVTLNSVAVQKAIDECAAQGGGTVLFSGGDYVLSTVFLKSNVTIRIEKHTRILGALSFYDYAPEEKIDYPAYQDQSHTYFDCSMFVGRDVENIKICGEGDIDMRSVWDEDNVRGIGGRGPKPIALKECNNVKIHDIEINNATDLAIYFAGCDDVEIYNIKMRVYIDGISPDNCKNVYIHDCDVESGDDGIVMKSSYTLNRLGVCDNIVVRNCRVKGEYLAWYCENVTFEHCVIIGTQPLCYCKNLTLIDCEMHECDLAFERSEVQATVTTPVLSIKNPLLGSIVVPKVGEIIMDLPGALGKIEVKSI